MKSFIIHECLTAELVNGNDLQSIADVIYKETGIPILIENNDLEILATCGLDTAFLKESYPGFKASVHERKDEQYFKTRRTIDGKNQYLSTPVMLQKKCFGFCSFIYNKDHSVTKVDLMILERVASVCSLYMLNEKTAFKAIERIKGHLLNQIIDGDLLSEKEILSRGKYVQID